MGLGGGVGTIGVNAYLKEGEGYEINLAKIEPNIGVGYVPLPEDVSIRLGSNS